MKKIAVAKFDMIFVLPIMVVLIKVKNRIADRGSALKNKSIGLSCPNFERLSQDSKENATIDSMSANNIK